MQMELSFGFFGFPCVLSTFNSKSGPVWVYPFGAMKITGSPAICFRLLPDTPDLDLLWRVSVRLLIGDAVL